MVLVERKRAEDVGIVGMELYCPQMYVAQADLEKYDGVSSGKYTIGLGQTEMSIVSDREDVNSMCMTVVHSLLEKYNIDAKDVGRLEVGTESPLDKSKSVKTVLMQLFEESGNASLEGVDSINACYGGTAALFNSVAWVESSAWDGRYAVLVMADIAVYESGPARPSGGAGAVAILVGPNAPLVMEPCRGNHFEHAYDFYKPDLASEYPIVDGHVSIGCYLRAVEKCMGDLNKRVSKERGIPLSLAQDNIKYQLFHQPFAKMVQKAWPRMILSDYNANEDNKSYADVKELVVASMPNVAPVNANGEQGSENINSSATQLSEKDQMAMEKSLVKIRNDQYMKECDVGMALGRRMGNIYTGSLYLNLATLFTDLPGHVPVSTMNVGDRILMFSYGSGLAATAFTLRLNKPQDDDKLKQMISVCSGIKEVLDSRTCVSPENYANMMIAREKAYNVKSNPDDSVDETIADKTYYLCGVDEKYRRFYQRKENRSRL